MEKRKYISTLSRYFFELPGLKKTIVLSLLTGIVPGILGYIFLKTPSTGIEPILYGSMMGLFFIWLPGIISGILTTAISTETPRTLTLRRSINLSFFSMIILSGFYVVGSMLPQTFPLNFLNLLIYGYVVIFILRALSIKITHPYTNIEVFGLGLIHPLTGYIFIYLSSYLTFLVTPIPLYIPFTSLLIKFSLSLVILSAGVIFFFAVINAPMKRNFGVTTLEVSRSVLNYWLDGSMDIEGLFTEMSEKKDTQANALAFRRKKDESIKSIFVVPYLHPGPFKGVGGGKLTEVFTKDLEEELETTVLLPHSSSTHDLNPADLESVQSASNQIKETLNQEIDNLDYSSQASSSIRVENSDVKILGQVLGDTALTVSTFSPKETDDLDTSMGLAIENKLKNSFQNGIHVDAHNCYDPRQKSIKSGDTKSYNLLESSEEARDQLESLEKHEMKLGIGIDKDPGFGEEEIGYSGIRTALIEVNGHITAYILVGGNNVFPGLREKVIEEVKNIGIDNVELMTTDSHEVNNLSSGETPVGTTINHKEIIEKIKRTVEKAIKDKEPVQCGSVSIDIKDVNVLGKDLVPTVNSTIAVTKKVGPVILIFSLILSLAAVTV